MKRYVQVYVPTAQFTEAKILVPNRTQLDAFQRGDKFVLKGRAGRLFGIDYQNALIHVGLLPENATIFRATGWRPIAGGEVVHADEYVSVMEADDEGAETNEAE